MTNNSNKTDTHIYNIINNPSPAFTEPCEACGVSEFQLGVRYAEERIIKLLDERLKGCSGYECETCDEQSGLIAAKALIKGEQK